MNDAAGPADQGGLARPRRAGRGRRSPRPAGTRMAAAHSRHSSARPWRAATSSSVPPGQATTSWRRSSSSLASSRGVEVGAAPAELPDIDEAARPSRGWRARPAGAGRHRSRRTSRAGEACGTGRAGVGMPPAGTDSDTRGSFTMVHGRLTELAEALRSAPGWRSKAHIAVVRRGVRRRATGCAGRVTTVRSCGGRRGGDRLWRGDPAAVRRAGSRTAPAWRPC